MNRIFLCLAFAIMAAMPALAAAQESAPLRNSLRIERVSLARDNAIAGRWDSRPSCSNLTGTHAGNTIRVEAVGAGGDGRYRHTLAYSLGGHYRIEETRAGQRAESRRGNGDFKVELPELDDEVPFVQQSFFLITRDGSGQTVTTAKTILVSRPVILGVSNASRARGINCSQRYEPYPSVTGILSNGSTNLSSIEIRQGIEKIWSATRGWQWGVYISPFSFTGLGSLFALHAGYFTQASRQTVETVEVTSQYQLSPGDYMQVYVQPTRYVTAYDATVMDPCGEKTTYEAAYLFQWWGFSYHVYPVNPFDGKLPPLEAIGAPATNTCPAELTPASIFQGNSSSAYDFRGTNL